MNRGTKVKWLACIGLLLAIAGGPAEAQKGAGDVFKGKLFPPNIVLEHKDELGLTKEQFTAIRAVVVEVQAGVAEHEWDLGLAYQEVMKELDNTPVDSGKVLEHIEAVLAAENEVKKLQVAMLVELRNLLTEEQMDYLRKVKGY